MQKHQVLPPLGSTSESFSPAPSTLPSSPSSAPPHPSLSVTFHRILTSLRNNRWLGLITGIWLLACAGSSATFGIYSPALKAVGGYNQQQIEGLAVAKDMGESVGLLPGLLSDVLPVWAIVALGAAHYMAGFSSLFCVATGRWQPLPFWQVRRASLPDWACGDRQLSRGQTAAVAREALPVLLFAWRLGFQRIRSQSRVSEYSTWISTSALDIVLLTTWLDSLIAVIRLHY